ncbi:HNH endonuclease [Endozoicomonas gorgoniicola]|uniref:HNH endonuclease n=1 Tax=Endozoicomonas gorgoniicola TaxID=1234144 RepID=A0ABT3MX30_9GAMM|nr:HNH endonuclease domain-containing protein [Endozoicomonas gorgoniicola]MCW7553915.1 HNH endonuclease [Endozoicomonas gorgoniicola]
MSRFYEIEPTLENYWRGIILFGKNVASYKFALAKSLHQLASSNHHTVTLEQLAVPFSRHICQHLETAEKQTTSRSSRFLDVCTAFNRGEIDHDKLVSQTVKFGFENVIDAFHNVNRQEIGIRFFEDGRKKADKNIYLTDNLFKLSESSGFNCLNQETEARWKLVETAWQMGISKNLLSINHDIENNNLFSRINDRRITITSSRDSLNGYQKGRCFYCYDSISIETGHPELADVDHFMPWMLRNELPLINGIWNLVLACKECNRGVGGKFEQLPSINLLERLHDRNEYFINSHLPIRETLIKQTGKSEQQRRAFLQDCYNKAKPMIIHTWEPEPKASKHF